MEILAVNFKQDIIDIVKDENLLAMASKDSGVISGRNLFISVTKVCRNLGMNEAQIKTQKTKIKKDTSLFCQMISISTSKGNREALCIPLNKLNGWLFSISHNKVRADIREKLIEYKNECFDVLYSHFFNPNESRELKQQISALQKELRNTKLELTESRRSRGRLEKNLTSLEKRIEERKPAVIESRRGGANVTLDYLRYEERSTQQFDILSDKFKEFMLMFQKMETTQNNLKMMKTRFHGVYPEMREKISDINVIGE